MSTTSQIRLMAPKDVEKLLGVDAATLKKLTAKAGGPPSVTTKAGWTMYPEDSLFTWMKKITGVCEALAIAGADRPVIK